MYLGECSASFHITVGGAESILEYGAGESFETFKAAVLGQLALYGGHEVRFMTDEEYAAAVGPDTYALHCVPDFSRY